MSIFSFLVLEFQFCQYCFDSLTVAVEKIEKKNNKKKKKKKKKKPYK